MDKLLKTLYCTNNPRVFQYLASFTASLAALSAGSTFAWPSQIIDKLFDGDLVEAFNQDEVGWICSCTSLGGAILALFIGTVCDKVGRKLTMLFLVLVMELGWILIIFAQNLWMVLLGRFITGMVSGSYCVTVPLYIHEISEVEIRGSVGGFTQLMISVGSLLVSLIGISLDVKYYTAVCALFPVLFGVCFSFMPETPIFLLKNRSKQQCLASMKKLRSSEKIKIEMDDMERIVGLQKNTSFLEDVKDMFRGRATSKAFVIGVALALIKIGSGIDAIISYTSYILEHSESEISPQISTIIILLVQVFAGAVQFLVVERWGRKILLLLSEFIMSISLFLIALSFYLRDFVLSADAALTFRNIPLVALCFYMLAFCLGIGPIGWILTAEVFPNSLKGRAMSFCTFLIWLLAFAIVKFFSFIIDHWHISVGFFIFSFISLLGGLFILAFVPETKNKTYEEIKALLDKQ